MDFVRASLEKKGGDTVGTKKITRLALLTAIALTIFMMLGLVSGAYARPSSLSHERYVQPYRG